MLQLFHRLIRGRRRSLDSERSVLHRKYKAYKTLLQHNTGSLTTLSQLELLLREGRSFTVDHVLVQVESLLGSVRGIVEALNALCGGKFQELYRPVERVEAEVLSALTRKRTFARTDLVLPMSALSREVAEDVGGKASNFGEIRNRVGLPAPDGFSITAYACRCFLEHNNLPQTIDEALKGLDPSDTERLNQITEEITALILAAEVPEDLARAITSQATALAAPPGRELRVSVRSSATSEDSEASFAGQYSSILNVRPGGILDAYKEVVASTFTPRAVFYRRSKGYTEDDVVMSVLCLTMVEAQTSGVMYTVDPTDHAIDDIIISAAWGLGVSVVDGSAPVDLYRVGKNGVGLTFREIARKDVRVLMSAEGGLLDDPVPEDLVHSPCLDDQDVLRLADFGRRLEAHYGYPLDIEWARNQEGELLILQARPLNPMGAQAGPDSAGQEGEPGAESPLEALADGHPVLLSGGHCAAPGVASGLVHVLFSDQGLAAVPADSILVAPQTSPSYVSIMGRLRGIITDYGSVTGHMAAVAREFDLPTLVATENATKTLVSGQEITMDSVRRTVYQGRVESLLGQRKKVNPMAGSPVYSLTREAMDRLAPLTLTDPHAANFTPQGCVTLHDVIRLAHEVSMREMFRIGENIDEDGGTVRLKVRLPMLIYCVDLGGGLGIKPGKTVAYTQEVESQPFAALLKGMTREDIRWQGGTDVSMKGMVSLMAHSMINDPTVDSRFGGANYALISREYLNFNARLGYHFAVIDSFCGSAADENYVAFSFQGGAADIHRRGRRVRLIAVILERLGMRVELKGDMIRGEMKEGKAAHIVDLLDQIGRLLGAMRLLDMGISSEEMIPVFAEEFFKGNYNFGRA